MDILLLSSWKMLFRRRRRRDDTKETASPLRRRTLPYSCSFIDNDGDGNVFFVLLEKRSRYFPGTTTPNDEDENISFLPFLSSSFDASRKTRQNAIFFFFFFFFTRNDTARDAIDERTHQRKKTRLYFPR